LSGKLRKNDNKKKDQSLEPANNLRLSIA